MAREDGQFKKGNTAGKKHGKTFKTKLISAMRKESSLGLGEKATAEETEEAFLLHITKRALDSDDKDSGSLLKELSSKTWPSMKPTLEKVEFELDVDASPSEQGKQILDASAQGLIAPDVALLFIKGIKDVADIEQATDLKQRIEELEAALSERFT